MDFTTIYDRIGLTAKAEGKTGAAAASVTKPAGADGWPATTSGNGGANFVASEYNVSAFVRDVNTLIHNALLFNPPKHSVHESARELGHKWLVKLIPYLRRSLHIEPESQVCFTCGSPDSADDNQLAACDNCCLWYHQQCVGAGNLPDGQWYCPACVAATAKSGVTVNSAAAPAPAIPAIASAAAPAPASIGDEPAPSGRRKRKDTANTAPASSAAPPGSQEKENGPTTKKRRSAKADPPAPTASVVVGTEPVQTAPPSFHAAAPPATHHPVLQSSTTATLASIASSPLDTSSQSVSTAPPLPEPRAISASAFGAHTSPPTPVEIARIPFKPAPVVNSSAAAAASAGSGSGGGGDAKASDTSNTKTNTNTNTNTNGNGSGSGSGSGGGSGFSRLANNKQNLRDIKDLLVCVMWCSLAAAVRWNEME